MAEIGRVQNEMHTFSSSLCFILIFLSGYDKLFFEDMNQYTFQQTPLHMAVLGKHYDCLRILIDAGADIKIKDVMCRAEKTI